MIISIFAFLLLTIALSIDTFTAGLSYGIQKVHVPVLSVLLTSLISGLMYTLSLFAGHMLTGIIPSDFMNILSFLILFLLALYKLYDALPHKFGFSHNFTTVSISKKVNQKDVHVLSPYEAMLLSFILSVDSISAGIGIGLPPLPACIVFCLSVLIHLCSMELGLICGRLLFKKSSYDLSFLSAILLFLLAFLHLR